jgi:hypothetical protein
VYDDLDVDQLDLEDALSDMVGGIDREAAGAATDSVVTSLFEN